VTNVLTDYLTAIGTDWLHTTYLDTHNNGATKNFTICTDSTVPNTPFWRKCQLRLL